MSDFENFEFDLLNNDEISSPDNDFLTIDETELTTESDNANTTITDSKDDTEAKISRKRSSADFSPDMDLLLLTAQSSMILEGMNLILKHDFKSSNLSTFSEAIKGVDLHLKILQRNPENYKKLSVMLSKDRDCMEVQNITFNLYKNLYDEPPETESQKQRAFELIRDTLYNGYSKSLVSLALIEIKRFYLMTGDPDFAKIDEVIQTRKDKGASYFFKLEKHVNIARNLLKTGNFEINKGMKGREINIFIVKASQILFYYFSKTNYNDKANFYNKLYENFKKYFIVK